MVKKNNSLEQTTVVSTQNRGNCRGARRLDGLSRKVGGQPGEVIKFKQTKNVKLHTFYYVGTAYKIPKK